MRKDFIVIAFISILFFPVTAHAYLDPGSGSYMLQILLGAIAAGFFVVKHYWQKMVVFFKSKGLKNSNEK